MANAYFSIIYKDEQTYLGLFPETDGGESLTLQEVKDYLAFNRIEPENTDYINAMTKLSKPTAVLLRSDTGYPINEYFSLDISEDGMRASATFYPPSTGGNYTSLEEVLNDLRHRGIVVEPDRGAIERYLANRRYNTPILVARGIPPIEGRDGSIEYHFNTNLSPRPTLNPDGSVDFFNLNTISKCYAGQVLATLTPKKPGIPGKTVRGAVVNPQPVHGGELRFSKHVTPSEDRLTITSDVNGHVSLDNGKVIVSDIYDVADVDPSTGNVDYDGSIVIRGNVQTGYRVKATGNIEIKGVVEGALIQAGGDVIIARGFNGSSGGIIEAGGNVVANFIESGTVICGRSLHAESIMNSNVSVNGDIKVTGKKGFIVGGTIRSKGNITCKTIGSQLGDDTYVEVGIDPKLRRRYNKAIAALNERKANIDKMEPVITSLSLRISRGETLSPEHQAYFQRLGELYQNEKKEYDKLNDEYCTIVDEIDALSQDSFIKVSGNVYPGTVFVINDLKKRISKMISRATFMRDGSDVSIRSVI